MDENLQKRCFTLATRSTLTTHIFFVDQSSKTDQSEIICDNPF